jgi:hypothetical protein
MVERSLSMREVRGSIPCCSKVSFCLFFRVGCARPLTPRRSRHASAGPVESRAVAGVASEVVQTLNIHEVRFCQVPAPSSAAEDGADPNRTAPLIVAAVFRFTPSPPSRVRLGLACEETVLRLATDVPRGAGVVAGLTSRAAMTPT